MTTKAMIVPGTGLLSDFGTGSLGLPYAIFKWSLLSKLCRNKLLFVSNGAGPIREGLTGWFIKSSMRMADYRSFRSEYARNYLEKVGFDSSKDPIFPDLAFSLPQRIFTLKEKAPGGGYAVGVGLMDYYGEHGIRENGQKVYANYVTVMCNFIKWLLDRNYEVRILLGDTKHDDHVKEDVLTIMGNMGLEFNPEKIFDGSVSSVGELLSQISDVDYVVSPRFHNIIFGLMYDKPVVSLAYHPKFSSLMEEFGIAEYCHPLDHLDLDKLIMQFKMLVREKEKLIFLGKKKRDDYRADLEKQYSYILSRKFIN